MTQFAFDAQIASQPEAVRAALRSTAAPQLDPNRPVILTGIGTSLHACRVAGYWAAELSRGRIRPAVLEAHEYALRGAIKPEDQIVVVSHRGTKRFAARVLERAREAGASSVLICGQGVASPGGDVVLRTCPDETASTHSVSYTCALAVLGRVVAQLVGGSDAERFSEALDGIADAMTETLAMPAPTAVAARIRDREPLLLTGYGIDELTAVEGALKLKEAAYLWAEGMSVELALHGTPAVFETRQAAIAAVPDEPDGGRTAALLGMFAALGVTALTLGTGDCALAFARVDYLLRPFVSVIPLQRLAAELARLRGTNPDTTRADVEPWKSAIARITL